jgi:hypothetical protein
MAQQIEVQTEEAPARTQEVFRFYELAKKQEWQVRDMPWGELSPIPESPGSREKQARDSAIVRRFALAGRLPDGRGAIPRRLAPQR